MGFRVCHILSGDLWAGAEVMAFNLLKGLSCSQLSNDICVVLLNYGRLERELQQIGLKVFVIDEQKKSFGRLLVAFRRIVKDFRPDIIHSHRHKENILALIIGFTMGNLPVVATRHGMPENYEGKQPLGRRIFQNILLWIQAKFLHHIVAVSYDLQNNLVEELGFDRAKITVIHNGIELNDFNKKNNNEKRCDFGSAGRLVPVKDYAFMVDIAAKVVEENRAVDFVLAGEGPQKEMLQNKIATLELVNNFSLLGHVDEMPRFYRSIKTYMNTSIHEGIPMSILEAMSYSLPVIAPQTGGLGEIIRDGRDGFLVKNRNLLDFCRRCLQLVNDSNLAEQMGHSARRRIEGEFSAEIMVQKYMALYEYLVKTHRNHKGR